LRPAASFAYTPQGSGEHRPVDINALVEESLNLAYHGARAEKQGNSRSPHLATMAARSSFTTDKHACLEPRHNPVVKVRDETRPMVFSILFLAACALGPRRQGSDHQAKQPKKSGEVTQQRDEAVD
jgi:hypothetical protein